MKRARHNSDAEYCRFKGWEAGTTLHLIEGTYRITAIGEEAILVRRMRRGKPLIEVRWVHTLVDKEVISARPSEFALRPGRK